MWTEPDPLRGTDLRRETRPAKGSFQVTGMFGKAAVRAEWGTRLFWLLPEQGEQLETLVIFRYHGTCWKTRPDETFVRPSPGRRWAGADVCQGGIQ